jgi:hypothetical protein
MSRIRESGAATRVRSLVRLAGMTLATFLIATVAYAAVSSFKPSEGTVAPGGSTTASFTVVNSVTSCFTASAPQGFSVAFDGLGLGLLPLNCALRGARITMTVTAASGASPGDYEVTITETAVGGSLIDSHEWPFTVPAPDVTTTTVPATTTTTASAVTTTTRATTTSTQTAATTSTSSSATTATTSTGAAGNGNAETTGDGNTGAAGTGNTGAAGTGNTGAAGTGNTGAAGNDRATSTTGAATTSATEDSETASADLDAGPDTSPDDDTEVLAAGVSDENPPYVRYPVGAGADASDVSTRTVRSDQLRSQISRAVPLPLADAVLSPLVIAEFLARSLLESAKSLLIPLLIATLIGLGMAWRMRKEVDDDKLALSRQSVV